MQYFLPFITISSSIFDQYFLCIYLHLTCSQSILRQWSRTCLTMFRIISSSSYSGTNVTYPKNLRKILIAHLDIIIIISLKWSEEVLLRSRMGGGIGVDYPFRVLVSEVDPPFFEYGEKYDLIFSDNSCILFTFYLLFIVFFCFHLSLQRSLFICPFLPQW